MSKSVADCAWRVLPAVALGNPVAGWGPGKADVSP
jgi:hypothetical protein